MNLDVTRCVADCINMDCERNLDFTEVAAGVLISQSDFSDTCNEYMPYTDITPYLKEEEELDFSG